MSLERRREAMREALALDEAEAVRRLGVPMSAGERAAAVATGIALVDGARARPDERPHLDAFLQEFGLSNPEGLALLCIAEALLRIPDDATADRLIAEKLASGDWASHAGRSDSLFVNASTWGLMLTGRLVDLPGDVAGDPSDWLGRLARRVGEPVVRRAVRRAMQIIGGEFVVGRTIGEALARSACERDLALCSYDMLGEGARTDADAARYFEAYREAIAAIGASVAGSGRPEDGPHGRSSISIKLSALDPRYALVQRERVAHRLVPRALELARAAAAAGIALTIDAEEADRLEISLEVIEALARDPATRDWPGLGLAVQAYGKRAPALLDWVATLAADTSRRLAVRLVKGAYWDAEIKRAQERGLDGYPVYTRKVSTDVAYLACARRLLGLADRLYPQFATHNAHTIGAVLAMRGDRRCEFQRLHGMGWLLYDEARRQVPDFPPVRVYAPVGAHADLLAYLVRRLLENGANTSFVNRFLDQRVPAGQVVVDPIERLAALDAVAHPAIPLPAALYGDARRNSRGVDFGDPVAVASLQAAVARSRGVPRAAEAARGAGGATVPVLNPADRRDRVGEVRFATAQDVAAAVERAARAQPGWNEAGADARARCLEAAADALERDRDEFVALLVREAGKTLPDAVAEVREAADFCRYYAAEARRQCGTPLVLPGPTGEIDELSLHGRGVFACVSPWNFPLAIFTGQVAAALAAGNAVVAKPAEATPLVAAAMVQRLHAAGVPADVLHLLPMDGPAFGEAALAHPALAGVAFTGSTATGRWIQRRLAARDGPILPLVAETGGLNAMIVDSTALPEQVVDDVMTSAVASAGQRCSALRLLWLQEDVADRVIGMLAGAMDALVIGDPADPATDVGPVISARAAAALQGHVERMRHEATIVKECGLDARHAHGSFVAPCLVELRDPAQLDAEQFGPILHVVRWRHGELDRVLAWIRASGYGLTLGVQTRLESTWQRVFRGSSVGNVYVNRNMIGAVVGVQPFGGGGLSGTGPKAGGPHYLARFAIERTLTLNTVATGGNTGLLALE